MLTISSYNFTESRFRNANALYPRRGTLRSQSRSAVWKRAKNFGETLQNMPDDLFSVGNYQIRASHVLIEQSYEGVLDRAARLASFGTSKPIESDTDIGTRQERQTVDDILMFAIHARRLITATSATSLARNVSVGLWEFAGTQSDIRFILSSRVVSMWRLLGIIIHYDRLDVVRYQLQVKTILGASLNSAFEDILSGPHKYYFSPKIFLKSDKSEAFIVDILQMAYAFLDKVLYPIVRVCEDNQIFLESDYL